MSTYKPDFYAQKAKKEGYSARSVYKLEEIHYKYLHNLHKAKKVLDLGAAPGSWSQYLQKKIPKNAEILAVDIQDLNIKFLDTPKITLLKADFTDNSVMENLISQGPFDFILSDAAPFTTGNKSVDTARSEQLVEVIAYISERALSSQGMLVAKLFQGGGAATLLKDLRNSFSKVVCCRPKAVKSSSFEAYLVCI